MLSSRKTSNVTHVSLVVLLLCNLVDLIATIYWVQTGQAVEANPLMVVPFEHSVTLFTLTKVTLVSLGAALLHRCRAYKLAAYAAVAACVAYVAILIWHAYYAIMCLGNLRLLGL